ncbi:MAG: hypothetical protein A2048_03050 [Deltaproteobacteria bacterium GWA2_45_12]|nr:MAG: hypothetical protein A2048_03050 [Deltaproteobacteria bacterium GWA2_45_12]
MNYDGRALEAAQRFAAKIKKEDFFVESMTLHGAEPSILSAKTLGEIINILAESTHDIVRIQSNGTRFTADYLDQLLKIIGNPKRFFVGISIDGSAKIHNEQRDNSWQRVTHNINELNKRGFRIGLLSVITPLTLQYLPEFEKWIEQTRPQVESISFKLGEHGYGLNDEENLRFAKWLVRTKNLKSLQAFQPDLCMHQGNRCVFFEFDIDGNCYACNKNFNQEGVFANWFNESFSAIVAKRLHLFKLQPINVECLDCSYKPVCESGCPASRIQNRSVDCLIKKTVYAKLAEEGIDFQRFFRIEGRSTEESFRVARGHHKLLLKTRPFFQSRIRLEGHQLMYQASDNKKRTLLLKPRASEFLNLFLENRALNISQALNRFDSHNDFNEELGFLKQLYERGIILGFE